MGRYIVKIKDCYMEWSTIVDAPVTYGMTLEEFKKYYRKEYGEAGFTSLSKRLERVDQYGTSAIPPETVERLISGNRAGENETCLTLEEIYRLYYTDV